MTKVKRIKKFAQVKRIISAKDERLQKNREKAEEKKKNSKTDDTIRHINQTPSHLFFQHNKALGPPYHILVDTNFINKTIQNKLELVPAMMDCLFAKCIPCITDCVIAEIEKLGPKFRLALRLARDPSFERLPCDHKGSYADDCIIHRVRQHACYIVATNDRDLKQRIRKIPGIPIMYVGHHRYAIERLPEAPTAFV